MDNKMTPVIPKKGLDYRYYDSIFTKESLIFLKIKKRKEK